MWSQWLLVSRISLQRQWLTEPEWAAEALLDIPEYQKVWKDRDLERNVQTVFDMIRRDGAKSTEALLPLPPQIALTAESLVGTAVLHHAFAQADVCHVIGAEAGYRT